MPRPSRPRIPSSPAPHVALLIETSLASGREILRGIAEYVREHGPWSLFHSPGGLHESDPGWLRRWQGDGIIARVASRGRAKLLERSGLPVVDVLGLRPASGFPLVHVDDAAIARLAADHFRERGFQRFAFYGIRGETWSEQRREAFVGSLDPLAPPPDVFEVSRYALQTTPWEGRQDRLARWLSGLAKPVGLLISSDQRGPDVLEACRRGGALVPEEVAVVGVDDDEPLCEVCNPPLSSVVPDHRQVGYQAAALLDDLMKGHPPPTGPRLIAPKGLTTRTSSDVLAVNDPLVAAALQFIRAWACNNIGVDRVVQAAGTSRSVLQRRFRLALGRTIHDQLISQRIKNAVQLITGTELSLAAIAEKSGFRHQEYMGAVFKARLGRSPAELRKGKVR